PTTAPAGPTTSTTIAGPPVNWGPAGATTRMRGSESFRPWMSGDGRFLAYDSKGKRNVAGTVETDEARDVYVHDAVAGTTQRITMGLQGGAPDGESERATLSSDGRYVAFWSVATNLVSGDTNGHADAFVHDRQTGTTTRVSKSSSGTQGNSDSKRPVMSRDGRFVAFESDATNLVGSGTGLPIGSSDNNNANDVFLHELATGKTSLVSSMSDGRAANGDSDRPSISADGRYVAFNSLATNLVSGDTNGNYDIFVRDTVSGSTTRVNVSASGVQASGGNSLSPSISGDGRWVAFSAGATNLVSGQDNGTQDVYLKDLQTGGVTRVSNNTGGGQANGDSADASISWDGRFVAYWSSAGDIVAGDNNSCPTTTYTPTCPDIFVWDRQTGANRRVSVSTAGVQGDRESLSPALSVDGRFVAFDSKASNLFPDDPGTSGQDIFVHVN
ncbi:MAG: TolB family protein, partial [Acidimicrobiia bacterium]